MTSIEKRFLTLIQKNFVLIFALLFTALMVAARGMMFSFPSYDMQVCLVPWFKQIKEAGGFASLAQNIGDYNLLYLTFLSALSYIDADPMLLIKLLSVSFDFLLAIAAGVLVYDHSRPEGRLGRAVLAYCAVLALPTVIINSAFWGQCDAMYTSFLLLCLMFLGRDRHRLAFVMYGIALALKLQAIFLLPFLLVYYYKKRRFSILNFLLVPIVMVLCAVPAMLAGRPLLDVFSIYVAQTGSYSALTLNYPNIYTLLMTPDGGYAMGYYQPLLGVLMLAAVLLLGFCYCANKAPRAGFKSYLVFAAWSEFAAVLLLPHMHERYGFALELILVVLAFCDRRLIPIAVGSAAVGIFSYMPFLFSIFKDQMILSFFNAALFILLTFGPLRRAFCLGDAAGKSAISDGDGKQQA